MKHRKVKKCFIMNIYHVLPDSEIKLIGLNYKIKQKIKGDAKCKRQTNRRNNYFQFTV